MKQALTLLACLVSFCGSSQNPYETSRATTIGLEQQLAERSARSSITHSNNAFALDLYQQLRSEKGNLFLSPYSVSSCVAMVYAGARGRTEQQIAKAFHFSLPQEKLHLAFGQLQSELNERQAGPDGMVVRLSIANSLWPARGLSLRQNYVELIQKHYSGCMTPLDYTEPEAARQTINNWVEARTENKIQDLIPHGAIDGNTRLVLANTIYFRGLWLTPFPVGTNTLVMPFQVSSNETVSMPMMHRPRLSECRYYEDNEAQLLELPYKDGNISMLVVLPRKVDGLEALESRLTFEKLTTWVSLLARKNMVDVWLPRFKLTSEFRLDTKLKALGMVDAFGAADFSGMFNGPGPSISAVFHKAFVDVNEEGTEAAAATAIILRQSLVETIRFCADHPFLFFIRERRTGAILFVGRLVNPEPGKQVQRGSLPGSGSHDSTSA